MTNAIYVFIICIMLLCFVSSVAKNCIILHMVFTPFRTVASKIRNSPPDHVLELLTLPISSARLYIMTLLILVWNSPPDHVLELLTLPSFSQFFTVFPAQFYQCGMSYHRQLVVLQVFVVSRTSKQLISWLLDNLSNISVDIYMSIIIFTFLIYITPISLFFVNLGCRSHMGSMTLLLTILMSFFFLFLFFHIFLSLFNILVVSNSKILAFIIIIQTRVFYWKIYHS